ncbi:rod-binding protein [Telmatospirillum sp.]|uniref:rod-binding protein n=1 Tax=Telmatospirillum sp. TaxID=2079197 RepID=UPI002841EEA2|nr:rod-binding protein [Telmatospirillum sp.]MDR3440789.1 rod-binding protein [Telmatospirillum sp.]
MLSASATQPVSSSFSASMLSAQSSLASGQSDKAASSLGTATDMASAKKTAQNFEAVFLTQMYTHMFEGVGKDSLFGGGAGEEMFRPMLLDEYGKIMANHGGIGIADSVMQTLIRQQEKTK